MALTQIFFIKKETENKKIKKLEIWISNFMLKKWTIERLNEWFLYVLLKWIPYSCFSAGNKIILHQ